MPLPRHHRLLRRPRHISLESHSSIDRAHSSSAGAGALPADSVAIYCTSLSSHRASAYEHHAAGVACGDGHNDSGNCAVYAVSTASGSCYTFCVVAGIRFINQQCTYNHYCDRRWRLVAAQLLQSAKAGFSQDSAAPHDA